MPAPPDVLPAEGRPDRTTVESMQVKETGEPAAAQTGAEEEQQELDLALLEFGLEESAASELDRRPRLPSGLERELIAAAKAGEREARAQLIEAFLPLIASVARIYRASPQIERIELLQEGVVGLLRALDRYDPERGVPFWGYAAWWVRQAMQQLVAELTRPVVLSDRALRQLARMKDFHRAYVQAQGREPTHQELAAGTDLTNEQVANLIASDQPARAIDEPLPGEDGSLGTFGELLVDPIAEDAYERALDEIEVEQLRSLLSGLSD